MVPKCENPSDYLDLVFKPRLEIVSDPKTTVKIIWKRGQILKVAAESDDLLSGLSSSELVKFVDLSTSEHTYSRMLNAAIRQATDNMKRMNIDVGNDWASILEPAPTGMAKEVNSTGINQFPSL